MFVISRHNGNICSSLYEIVKGRGKNEKMKRKSKGKKNKIYVFAEQHSSSIIHTNEKSD